MECDTTKAKHNYHHGRRRFHRRGRANFQHDYQQTTLDDFTHQTLPPQIDLGIKQEVRSIDNPATPEIAIDCEMVEARGSNRRRFSVLARVSIVNSDCQPLLDTYVDPMYQVTDYRTPYSGIRPEHLLNAPSYDEVRECVVNLVDGRTLIGHDLKQDLSVLGIENLPNIKLRDTSRCYLSYFKPNEKPSLKRLAAAILGQTIQKGAHDSMEDAKAAMRLYKQWIPLGRNEEEAIPVDTSKKKNKKINKQHTDAAAVPEVVHPPIQLPRG